MKIVIDIPDEQIKKSLEETKYILEDDGEKGFVTITMFYTNAQLEFVDVERDEDFYSCDYKVLPEGHGRLIDADKFLQQTLYNPLHVPYISKEDVLNAPTITEDGMVLK